MDQPASGLGYQFCLARVEGYFGLVLRVDSSQVVADYCRHHFGIRFCGAFWGVVCRLERQVNKKVRAISDGVFCDVYLVTLSAMDDAFLASTKVGFAVAAVSLVLACLA